MSQAMPQKKRIGDPELADGTFITVSNNDEAYSLQVGADGEACQSRTNNNSVQITFTVGQGSSSNDELSTLIAADLLTGVGDLPFLLKDENGTTFCAAETARIVQYPEQGFDRSAGSRAWTIETDNLKTFDGVI